MSDLEFSSEASFVPDEHESIEDVLGTLASLVLAGVISEDEASHAFEQWR